ncbi:hypothetical protein BCR36DRAFT_298016, partial [Piromyces finnis]
PILAKAKEIEQKIEDEKLDYKARKALTAERKRLEEKDRVIPDFTTFEYEKKLRKLATRGVVKLFNAIKTAQEKSNEVHTLVTNKKPKGILFLFCFFHLLLFSLSFVLIFIILMKNNFI